MCLAVPGKIVTIVEESRLSRSGSVSFDGVQRMVSLVCVPEARIGDYVLVHAGMAIGRLDEAAADRTLELLSRALDNDAGGEA